MAESRAHRVALVNWTGRHAGGIESYIEFLLAALADHGYQVGLWTEQDTPPERLALSMPAQTNRWCAAADGVDGSVRALEQWAPSVMMVHGMIDEKLERRLLGLAPSVFVAHTYTGTCISGGKTLVLPETRPCERRFGPACLAMFYPRRCGGLSPITMVKDYRRQGRRLDTIRGYARVLTLSEHMRREYLRHGLKPDRVRTLPPFCPGVAVPQRHAALRRDRATLLFLGRIDRLKGCHLLIESLAIAHATLGRPIRLVIAGDGPDRSRCEQQAAQVRSTEVDVQFLGWVDSGDRSRLLAQTDVVVMPSLWPEPYGLSGQEAAAAGIPVAAFRVGAIPEWLHGGNGMMAPADPPTAAGLAAAIIGCLAMGRRAPVAASALQDQQAHHVAAVTATLDDVASQPLLAL